MKLSSRLVLAVSLVVVVLVSLFGVLRRHQQETSNRAVSITAEYDVIEAYASSEGITIEQALEKLKAQGLTGIILNEETVGELIGQGRISVRGTSYPAKEAGRRLQATSLLLNDPGILLRLQRGFHIRFGELAGRMQPRDSLVALPPLPPGLVRTASLGLNPEQLSIAKAAKLQVIGRFANSPAFGQRAITETIEWMKESGVDVFMPLGDQVLGRKELTKFTAEKLKLSKIPYSSPEFTKLGGDAEMVGSHPDNVIRLHSATAAERDKISFDATLDRFRKAARERNIRILLLRPTSQSSAMPFSEFSRLVGTVTEEIKKDGLSVAPAHTFLAYQAPRVYGLLLGLAGAVLLIATFRSLPFGRIWQIMLGLGALALGGLSATGSGLLYMALAVAIAAPCAGYLLAEPNAEDQATGAGVLFWRVLIISLASLAAALFVAAAMTGTNFMVKAEEFRGIKASVGLPIALVAVYFWTRLTDWRAGLLQPITWGTAGLGGAVGVVIMMLLARTGNDSGAEASGLELAFRSTLDNIMYVRPRTKEFLLGHPVLWVALGMYGYKLREGGWLRDDPRFRAWIILLLAVGAIGQTGIVNTLCHGHIPVQLSVARVLIGWALGSILGVLAWTVVKRFLPPEQK